VCEQEFGAVHHVHGEELTGDNAILAEVLAISAGIGVGFGPCVAAGARPDAFFGRGQAADLGFELVPQRLALALCWCLVRIQQTDSLQSSGLPFLSRSRAAAFRTRWLLRSLVMWYLASM
jgi:hypothetical protein